MSAINYIACVLSFGIFINAGVMTARAASVVTIYSNDNDVAVVFVHGLNGHPIDSFKSVESGLSWPDLIRSDHRLLANRRSLSDFDIYAVDYSDVFVSGGGVDVSVEEMVQQVDTALRAHGLMKAYNHVWIVAHSLGGIVIKRLLIKWQAAGLQRYLDRVASVSLLGVPSNGAPLADMASSDYLTLVTDWLGYNAAHVSDLKTIENMNTFLRSVENDWATLLARRSETKLPIVSCAYETVAEYKIRFLVKIKIVPEIYTKTGCDGESQPINKTHIRLPKPESASDAIENWLYNSVDKSLAQLDQSGRVFDNAGHVGELWNLVYFIQRGHKRASNIPGLAVFDEAITISAKDLELLKALKLNGSHFSGATYADVMEHIEEENKCVVVNIRDSKRRDIEIVLDSPISCPEDAPLGRALVCQIDNCQ